MPSSASIVDIGGSINNFYAGNVWTGDARGLSYGSGTGITGGVARAFVEPVSTVARRISRAKNKIAEAGIRYRVPDPDEAFAPLLDAIAGMPMVELLEAIALSRPVRDALVDRTGPYAGPLTLAEAYEQGAWGTVRRHASSSGLDPMQIGAAYVQSLAWTRDRLLSMAGA